MIQDLLHRIHNVISQSRIELYCFLYFLSTHMINLPLRQLIFDKICLNDYRLGTDSCYSLVGDGVTGQPEVNNQIQSTITQLTLYQHTLSTIPSIILTVLLGHWIDTRLDHLRYILALPCIGGAILNIFLTVQCINFNAEPMDTIYPFLLTGLSGGETLAITGAYAFVCKSTEPKHRPIRFIILEAVSAMAIPLANFLSSRLLYRTPWIYGQYRNHIGVFLVSGSILTFTEFWILITLAIKQANITTNFSAARSRSQSRKMSQISAYDYYRSLRDTKARRVTAFSLQMPSSSNRRESSISYMAAGPRRTSVATLFMGFSMMNKSHSSNQQFSMGTLSQIGSDTRRASAISNPNNINKPTTIPANDFTFLQVIHYENALMAFKSFLRPRVNNGRSQLICLTLSMVFVFFTVNSNSVINESYTSQLFDWTKVHSNQINDVKIIITSFSSVLIMTILVRLLSFRDEIITLIGLTSIFISFLLKGLLVYPISFYLSSIFEILCGLSLSGLRSIVSSIVYNYEIAKIFTIIASLMTQTRPLATLLFVKLTPSILHSKVNHIALYCIPLLIVPFVTIIFHYTQKSYSYHQSRQKKSSCTIQIAPNPGPSMSSIPKSSIRRGSSRF